MVPMWLYWDRVVSINNLFYGKRHRICGEVDDELFGFILSSEVRNSLKESFCYTAATEMSPARFDACVTEFFIMMLLNVNIIKEEAGFNFYVEHERNEIGVRLTYVYLI